jgi:hypothetical protein
MYVDDTGTERGHMMKDKLLAQIKINNQQYSIRATVHALQRMAERKVDEYVVTGNVLALGEKRLLALQEEQTDAIVIDKVSNTSTVITFNKNTIKIVTVIDKANVFVKSNTKIERI